MADKNVFPLRIQFNQSAYTKKLRGRDWDKSYEDFVKFVERRTQLRLQESCYAVADYGTLDSKEAFISIVSQYENAKSPLNIIIYVCNNSIQLFVFLFGLVFESLIFLIPF